MLTTFSKTGFLNSWILSFERENFKILFSQIENGLIQARSQDLTIGGAIIRAAGEIFLGFF